MPTKTNDLVLPPEFSGEAQLILYTRYGDPREAGWDMKWINNWHIKEKFPWFPQEHIQVHKHFQTLLENAYAALQDKNLHLEIKTIDCSFDVRPIKGSNTVLSAHSWGAAIDMNSKENDYGSKGDWSPSFIEVMSKYNIYCGQNWSGRKDPMHFSMVNG